MQDDKINIAIVLATKFLRFTNEYYDAKSKTYVSSGHTFTPNAPKQSGALRRASMELTRALAEMRKP